MAENSETESNIDDEPNGRHPYAAQIEPPRDVLAERLAESMPPKPAIKSPPIEARSFAFNHSRRVLQLSWPPPGKSYFTDEETAAEVRLESLDALLSTVCTGLGVRTPYDMDGDVIQLQKEIVTLTAAAKENIARRDTRIQQLTDENQLARAQGADSIRHTDLEEAIRERIAARETVMKLGQRLEERDQLIDTLQAHLRELKANPAADRIDAIGYDMARRSARALKDDQRAVIMDARSVEHFKTLEGKLIAAESQLEVYRSAPFDVADLVRAGIESAIGTVERLSAAHVAAVSTACAQALDRAGKDLDHAHALADNLDKLNRTLEEDHRKMRAAWQEACKLAEHRKEEILREANLVNQRDTTIRNLQGEIANTQLTLSQVRNERDKMFAAHHECTLDVEAGKRANAILNAEVIKRTARNEEYDALFAIWRPVIEAGREFYDAPERQYEGHTRERRDARDNAYHHMGDAVIEAVDKERPKPTIGDA